ncbi:MAG TPA: hypothetical protein VF668_01375 [Pyrinomonadaceae bacterium]|jgi:hypothetical protein
MAKETECALHGKHARRVCPACSWCRDYPSDVTHASGCPLCGRPLHSNGLIMTCVYDDCRMRTTSHPPATPRRRVSPREVGLKGGRL